MKNKKAYFLGLIAASMFLGQVIFAAEVTNQNVSAQPTVAKGEMTILADINFRSPILLKQESTKLDIYFRLENNFPKSEAGIRYGVQLIKDKTIVDEKVFTDDVLSVEGNNSIQKIFSYTLPSHLSGEFEIWLVAKNESGLPLALFKLEKPVVLNGTGEYLEINDKSCVLKIDGEAVDKKYNLAQGVSLKPEEVLRLICEVTSHFKNEVTAGSLFNTYERTLFGNLKDKDRKGIEMIFKQGEKKTVEFIIEKPRDPQAYEVKLDLVQNSAPVSSPIIFHYVIAGESATIQKLDLDKIGYEKGDVINATLLWSGSANNFSGSRTGRTDNGQVRLSLSISNQVNQKCSEILEKTLEPNSKEAKFSLVAKTKCADPRVVVVLKNEQGKMLAQKEFNFLKGREIVPQKSGSVQSKKLLILVGAIIAIILVLIVLVLKKKGIIAKVLPLLIMTLLGMSFGNVEAATISMGADPGWSNNVITVHLDKDSYSPGETISVTASGSYWEDCGNNTNWMTLDSSCGGRLISAGEGGGIWGSGSCSAALTAGSHSINLTNELFGECAVGTPFFSYTRNANSSCTLYDSCPGVTNTWCHLSGAVQGEACFCERGECLLGHWEPSTCFRAGQKVRMADNSLKNIEEVMIGEKVRGEGGAINTVLGYERPIIGSRKIYIINGKVEFTGDHPFLSTDGWKVADMNLFRAFPRNLPTDPTRLEVGDLLITENGMVAVETLEERSDSPFDETVYDLKLNGNNTYIIEGFVVHNCGS